MLIDQPARTNGNCRVGDCQGPIEFFPCVSPAISLVPLDIDLGCARITIEHGLKLGTPTNFSLLRYEKEIDRLERWCNSHLNTPLNLLTQEKRMLVNRFFEEVAVQVRRTVEHANQDAEIWIKAIMSPMETQVREHQVQLRRRLESIRRIHLATDTLDERIGELEHAARGLQSQIASLQQVGAAMEAQLSSAKNRVAAAAAA